MINEAASSFASDYYRSLFYTNSMCCYLCDILVVTLNIRQSTRVVYQAIQRMVIIENLRFCGVSSQSNRMLVYTNQRDHIGSQREGKNRQTCYSIIILCIRDLIFFVVVHNKYNTLSPQFHWMIASERFFIAIISRKTHGIVYCTQVMTFTEEHFDFAGEMIQKASYLNQSKYFSISYSTYMSENASLELPRLRFLNAILTQKSSQLLF